MTTANQNLAGVYNTGFTQAGAAADYMQCWRYASTGCAECHG